MRTRLWKTTLARRSESDTDLSPDPRERLRVAFLAFRDRAQVLAAEINRDLPEFTVHDISHVDALWEMTDLVAGSNYELTPTEALVLGGAFFVHDLGLSLAAYPEGLETLRRERPWNDTLAAIWQNKFGRSPTAEELQNPPPEVEKLAIAELLRSLHARRAERLVLDQWQTHDGETYHLIEAPELRRHLGPIIGRIAHSHWWSVERVGRELTVTLGAPSGYPREWTVDPLKLACLLRVADAGHIDSRRAPGFLEAVRSPQGFSGEHWTFQEHLHQPRLVNDRLVYTAGRPFNSEEAAAWWLCFDTLQMLDRELRQVDALLADSERPRLAAKSVAGAEDPRRLASLIPTEGWVPLDARIKVGNVAALVERLGGEQLYGDDPLIPLRELVQNASDAVRARRAFEGRPETWGALVVRIGEDSQGPWVEVEDNGIGMSTSVLTEVLLDFGATYWNSDLMRQELPGLLSSGFRPTGEYGIGFFSVFMWGERVRVVTRRPDVAQRDTLVLEFTTGLESRPLLRQAKDEELMRDGGTRVRVWLRTSPYNPKGLLYHAQDGAWSLTDLCAWLCPAVDVNLFVEQGETRSLAVAAGDWQTVDEEVLLRRLVATAYSDTRRRETAISRLAGKLRLMRNEEGTAVGRACIDTDADTETASTSYPHHSLGVVTVGGLRATRVDNLAGILVGSPDRAARDVATPVVGEEELARWATDQANIAASSDEQPEELAYIAELVRAVRGKIENLPIALTVSGWVTMAELSRLWQATSEVRLASKLDIIRYRTGDLDSSLTIPDDVIVVTMEVPVPWLPAEGPNPWPMPTEELLDHDPEAQEGRTWFWIYERTLEGAVIEALAQAWGTSPLAIVQASEERFVRSISLEWTLGDGEIISVEVPGYLVKRPTDLPRSPHN
jgi:Histidine kinase-, DNA gyrase B-, and HSP90-like ATPase